MSEERSAKTIEKYFHEAGPHYGQLMRFVDRTSKHYSNPEEAKKRIEETLKREENRKTRLQTLPLHYQLSSLKELMRISLAYKKSGDDLRVLEIIDTYSLHYNHMPNINTLKNKIEEYHSQRGNLPFLGAPFERLIRESTPRKNRFHPEKTKDVFSEMTERNWRTSREINQKLWEINIDGFTDDGTQIKQEMSERERDYN